MEPHERIATSRTAAASLDFDHQSIGRFKLTIQVLSLVLIEIIVPIGIPDFTSGNEVSDVILILMRRIFRITHL